MKKRVFYPVLFLTVILVMAAGAFTAKADFETVITEKGGGTHVEAGTAASDTADEYEIKLNGKRVISVKKTVNSAQSLFRRLETKFNGYYSVEFEVTENTSAYIAGLSKSNKDELQAKLISAAYNDEKIDLESLDFIDAEKVKSEDGGDDLLCWAATTSNILWYTGWGRAAGFGSEDDIFDTFRDSFTDDGGNAFYGIPWFINGYYSPQTWQDWSHLKENAAKGGYLPEYSAQKVVDYYNDMPGDIRQATDALRRGGGAYLSVDWFDDGQSYGGHALTFWGYIYDSRYETERDNNPDYIKAVIISDSDSNRDNDERRMSPNILHICNTSRYTEYGKDTFVLDTLYNGNGIIDCFVTLVPYSEDMEKETDAGATLDTNNTTDFTAKNMVSSCDGIETSVFLQSDTIEIIPVITLNSSVPFDGELEYSITIDSQLYKASTNLNIDPGSFIRLDPIVFSNLAPGEYDVKINVNPDKTIEEAHYYDNVYTGSIKVLGDAPDISGAKMTALIGAQSGGALDVSFEYENTDNIFSYMGNNYATCLAVSYYEDEKWSDWEWITESFVLEDVFSENGSIDARGEKVKFMAAAMGDEKPCLRIFSDEYGLDYIKFSVDTAEGNTGEYTRLPQNASSLADGEKFAFEIFNRSTYDADAVFDLQVAALQQYSNNIIILCEEKDLTASRTGEPLLREITSWDDGIILSGRYSVYAYISGDFGEDGVLLGNIEVKEAPSTVINTPDDAVDEYDGRTSLREAVAFCGESDVVTIEDGTGVININDTIVIDKPVSIDFSFDDTEGSMENPYGAQLGTAINANENCRIFEVSDGGRLKLSGVALIGGKAKDTGGAILLDGGTAELNGCRIFNCKSGRAGGGIYLQDGSLILKDCSFKLNESGYGAAIGSDETGKIDMINCTFFGNSSNAGAVYTNGKFTAINSTFEGNTAKSSGASAVTATGIADAALINCIAADTNALNSNVKVFGCILGETPFSGDANGSRLNVSNTSLFKTDEDGKAIWTGYSGWRCIQYAAKMSREAENGVTVKNQDGYLTLEYDGGTLQTGIPSAFSDEDLAYDAYGNERDGCCGSFNIAMDEAELSLTDNNLFIYVYEGFDAEIICAQYDENGNLVDISIISEALKNGTNIIPPAGNAAKYKYMMWEGLKQMKPICPSVSN